MNHMFRFAMVVVAAFAVSAPTIAAEKWPDSFSAYVANVRKTVKTVNLDGYLSVAKNPNGAMLIDVREPSEYAIGDVTGAVNIPRGLLEFQIWKKMGYPKKVDTNKTIDTQYASGGRATLAAADLKKISFTNVIAVVANVKEFEKKGFPWKKK